MPCTLLFTLGWGLIEGVWSGGLVWRPRSRPRRYGPMTLLTSVVAKGPLGLRRSVGWDVYVQLKDSLSSFVSLENGWNRYARGLAPFSSSLSAKFPV